MGEIISQDRFVQKYKERYGLPPVSYYHHGYFPTEGYTPSYAEIGFFLKMGDVIDEHPWGKMRYARPGSVGESLLYNDICYLSTIFDTTQQPRVSRNGIIIGHMLELTGTYKGERGQPIVRVTVDGAATVKHIDYMWKKPKGIAAGRRETQNKITAIR